MYLKQPLDDKMIEAGEALTRELVKTGIIVKASLWFFISESQIWRLIIATPEVSTVGPKKIYQKIQKTLTKLADDTSTKLTLENIAIVENNNPLITLFRSAINTGSHISRVRFSNTTINGQTIEDAYIYLMF